MDKTVYKRNLTFPLNTQMNKGKSSSLRHTSTSLFFSLSRFEAAKGGSTRSGREGRGGHKALTATVARRTYRTWSTLALPHLGPGLTGGATRTKPTEPQQTTSSRDGKQAMKAAETQTGDTHCPRKPNPRDGHRKAGAAEDTTGDLPLPKGRRHGGKKPPLPQHTG